MHRQTAQSKPSSPRQPRRGLWLATTLVCAALGQGALAQNPGNPSDEDSPGEVFLSQIAPVLVERCIECHNAERRSAGLCLDRIAGLVEGGNSGSLWQAGQPDESLLIQKIRGTAPDGQRMPRGRPPLEPAVIEQLAAWVAQGASFGDADQQTLLAALVRARRSQRLSADELSAQRAELAAGHWRLTAPDESPRELPSDHFLLLGSDAGQPLTAWSETAEELWSRLPELLRVPAEQPLIKGRVTLLVWSRRFDYVEFCRMVEGREAVETAGGHWRFDGIDAYVCWYARPERGSEVARAELAQLLTGLVLNSWGDQPAWLTSGVGRWVAVRLTPRHPDQRGWTQAAAAALAAQAKPSEIWKTPLPPEESAAVSYALVDALAKDRGRWGRFLGQLAEGQAADAALLDCYGVDLPTLTARLAVQLSKRRR